MSEAEETQNRTEETSAARQENMSAEVEAAGDPREFRRLFCSTLSILIIVLAVICLIGALVIPVFRVYGSDMEPSLHKGNLAVAVKKDHYETGDIVVFEYNSKTLIRRVIAEGGDWVEIDSVGNVTVNNEILQEPYTNGSSRENCDLEMPCEVPEGSLFVLADRRSEGVDSRQQAFGCISEDSVQGRLILRIWPMNEIGRLK